MTFHFIWAAWGTRGTGKPSTAPHSQGSYWSIVSWVSCRSPQSCLQDLCKAHICVLPPETWNKSALVKNEGKFSDSTVLPAEALYLHFLAHLFRFPTWHLHPGHKASPAAGLGHNFPLRRGGSINENSERGATWLPSPPVDLVQNSWKFPLKVTCSSWNASLHRKKKKKPSVMSPNLASFYGQKIIKFNSWDTSSLF